MTDHPQGEQPWLRIDPNAPSLSLDYRGTPEPQPAPDTLDWIERSKARTEIEDEEGDEPFWQEARRVVENGECGAQLEIQDIDLWASMVRNVAKALAALSGERPDPPKEGR